MNLDRSTPMRHDVSGKLKIRLYAWVLVIYLFSLGALRFYRLLQCATVTIEYAHTVSTVKRSFITYYHTFCGKRSTTLFAGWCLSAGSVVLRFFASRSFSAGSVVLQLGIVSSVSVASIGDILDICIYALEFMVH
jgi:hypothetical protein